MSIFDKYAYLGDGTFGPSLSSNKKEKKMDKPFVIMNEYGYQESFDTQDEAIKAAKKRTFNNKEDTRVWKVAATVTFPIPDYEVVVAAD